MIIANPKTDEELDQQGREIAEMIVSTTIEQQYDLWLQVIKHLRANHKYHTSGVLEHVINSL